MKHKQHISTAHGLSFILLMLLNHLLKTHLKRKLLQTKKVKKLIQNVSPFQVIHMLLIVIFIQSHIHIVVQPFTLMEIIIFLLNLVHLLNVQQQMAIIVEEDFIFQMQTLQ